ncbi:hypothetical protein E8D34_11490 [Nocardioides sp. GY 10113]|uniref:hypothetical protein n=1 Tax=Nocardioides sp. GY 10113 TaxID=2569761 RepID=UPI0010A7D147|nr:hypothetical protein [Nocardioides sp. GY 10113]TIC86292.1 hypothetical protein E8D34_11490 [Nocardioides sp. GY 10113]
MPAYDEAQTTSQTPGHPTGHATGQTTGQTTGGTTHQSGADAFWSEVRRRRPEVGLVLLPPWRGDHPAPAGAAEGRAAAAEVVAGWRLLATALAGTDAADELSAVAPSVGWRPHGDLHRFVVQRAVRGLGATGGAGLLRTLVSALGEDGWRLAPRTRRGLPVLEATDGRIALQGQAGPGATVLTMHGRPLAVPLAARRSSAAEVRALLAGPSVASNAADERWGRV